MSAQDEVGTMFADGPLEVVVWLECANDRLRDLAILLGVGDDPPVPEPHRRLLALTFSPDTENLEAFALDPAAIEGEDAKAVAYTEAFMRSMGMGALAAARAREGGIDVRVYAVRIQPEGADFPSSYQHAPRPQDDVPAGERG